MGRSFWTTAAVVTGTETLPAKPRGSEGWPLVLLPARKTTATPTSKPSSRVSPIQRFRDIAIIVGPWASLDLIRAVVRKLAPPFYSWLLLLAWERRGKSSAGSYHG